jgi:hypothetical protein
MMQQLGNDHFEAATCANIELHVGRGAAGDGLLVPKSSALQLQVRALFNCFADLYYYYY